MMQVHFDEPQTVAEAHQRLWDLQQRDLPRTARGRAKRWDEILRAFALYQQSRYEAALSKAPEALVHTPTFDS